MEEAEAEVAAAAAEGREPAQYPEDISTCCVPYHSDPLQDMSDVITVCSTVQYPSLELAQAITSIVSTASDPGLALQALLAAAGMAYKIQEAAATATEPSAALTRPYPGYPNSALRSWALDVIAHLHAEAAAAEDFTGALKDAHWAAVGQAAFHWRRMSLDTKQQVISHARSLESEEHQVEQVHAHPSMANVWDDVAQEFLFDTMSHDHLTESRVVEHARRALAQVSAAAKASGMSPHMAAADTARRHLSSTAGSPNHGTPVGSGFGSVLLRHRFSDTELTLAQHVEAIVQAMGNSGHPSFVPFILRSLAERKVQLASSAVFSLRKMYALTQEELLAAQVPTAPISLQAAEEELENAFTSGHRPWLTPEASEHEAHAARHLEEVDAAGVPVHPAVGHRSLRAQDGAALAQPRHARVTDFHLDMPEFLVSAHARMLSDAADFVENPDAEQVASLHTPMVMHPHHKSVLGTAYGFHFYSPYHPRRVAHDNAGQHSRHRRRMAAADARAAAEHSTGAAETLHYYSNPVDVFAEDLALALPAERALLLTFLNARTPLAVRLTALEALTTVPAHELTTSTLNVLHGQLQHYASGAIDTCPMKCFQRLCPSGHLKRCREECMHYCAVDAKLEAGLITLLRRISISLPRALQTTLKGHMDTLTTRRKLSPLTLLDIRLGRSDQWEYRFGSSSLGAVAYADLTNQAFLRIGVFGGLFELDINDEAKVSVYFFSWSFHFFWAKAAFQTGFSYTSLVPPDLLYKINKFVGDNIAKAVRLVARSLDYSLGSKKVTLRKIFQIFQDYVKPLVDILDDRLAIVGLLAGDVKLGRLINAFLDKGAAIPEELLGWKELKRTSTRWQTTAQEFHPNGTSVRATTLHGLVGNWTDVYLPRIQQIPAVSAAAANYTDDVLFTLNSTLSLGAVPLASVNTFVGQFGELLGILDTLADSQPSFEAFAESAAQLQEVGRSIVGTHDVSGGLQSYLARRGGVVVDPLSMEAVDVLRVLSPDTVSGTVETINMLLSMEGAIKSYRNRAMEFFDSRFAASNHFQDVLTVANMSSDMAYLVSATDSLATTLTSIDSEGLNTLLIMLSSVQGMQEK
ncbi:unnamed protein product, partial [Symbiodinium sp. KB8]